MNKHTRLEEEPKSKRIFNKAAASKQQEQEEGNETQ